MFRHLIRMPPDSLPVDKNRSTSNWKKSPGKSEGKQVGLHEIWAGKALRSLRLEDVAMRRIPVCIASWCNPDPDERWRIEEWMGIFNKHNLWCYWGSFGLWLYQALLLKWTFSQIQEVYQLPDGGEESCARVLVKAAATYDRIHVTACLAEREKPHIDVLNDAKNPDQL